MVFRCIAFWCRGTTQIMATCRLRFSYENLTSSLYIRENTWAMKVWTLGMNRILGQHSNLNAMNIVSFYGSCNLYRMLQQVHGNQYTGPFTPNRLPFREEKKKRTKKATDNFYPFVCRLRDKTSIRTANQLFNTSLGRHTGSWPPKRSPVSFLSDIPWRIC